MDDHGDFAIDAAEAPWLYTKMGRGAPLGGMHFIGNILVELDGDTAFTETYFMSIKDMEKSGDRHLRVRAGRYIDRLERRQQRWAIVERVVADEWNRDGRAGSLVSGAEAFRYGTHDKSDPVYAIRQGRVARTALDDPDDIARRIY